MKNPTPIKGLRTTMMQVMQTAHGFAVGNCLWFDGSEWSLAQANDTTTSEVGGIVSAIASEDVFILVTDGYIDSGFSGLTPGCVYFLSDTTPGVMISTPPGIGAVNKPIFFADSDTSGFVKIERGVMFAGLSQLPDPTGHAGEFLSTDGSHFYWVPGRMGSSQLVFTTPQLASGATGIYPVDCGCRSYQIRNIAANYPSRFRSYGNQILATLDQSRPGTLDPTGNHGMYLEVILIPNNLSWIDTPVPVCVNQDLPISNMTYFSIQNTDTVPRAITYTINILKQE